MNKKQLLLCVLFIVSLTLWNCGGQKSDFIILIPQMSSRAEQLAAKEIRRYIYARTDELIPVIQSDSLPAENKNVFLIANRDNPLLNTLGNEKLHSDKWTLAAQQYIIRTISAQDKNVLVICGGDESGVLYGAYRFIEELGVRFYVHGDVIPDQKIALELPALDLTGKPIFNLRGIQPFHDFPEGPDWWNLDDYKAIIAQLPKMGMNFLGFHTYPAQKFTGWSKAEPMVWIGTQDNINPDGTVKTAYPVLHSHTMDSTWAYDPEKTSGFSFGASLLFETDNYGAEYMQNVSPWPHSPEENIRIFNEFGFWQGDMFMFAGNLGVKTCIGTETPVVIPENVKSDLRAQGLDPESDAAVKKVYEGIFTRIQKTHPLDYYWFWTPEYWTWQDVPDKDVRRTEKDLKLAAEALKSVNAPFTLATCGWVLGPPGARAQFDRILPKDMSFSCINREVGFTPVDPDFAKLQNRPAWAITWLEDDPALVSPQLWVGRVRKDAVDAYRYGCTGYMGIHWRTQILAPAFSALAQSGWSFGDWQTKGTKKTRDLPVDDFYLDWAVANFGPEAAVEIAALFTKLDGGPLFIPGVNERTANLPRTSDWAGKGPGGVKINTQSWQEVDKTFAFVDEFAALESRVRGEGNKDRFNYWLNTFRYDKKMAQVGCILGQLDETIKAVTAEKESKTRSKLVREKALPLRNEAVTQWGEMVTLLLATVNTTGDLGTIANLEMHNLENLKRLSQHDSLMTAVLGEPVPEAGFWQEYHGPSRLIVPTKRTLLEKSEDLNLKVIILTGDEVKNAALYWRYLGDKKYKTKSLKHNARDVYNVSIPAAEINNNDFEYHIKGNAGSEKLCYPATAPETDQTVVVW